MTGFILTLFRPHSAEYKSAIGPLMDAVAFHLKNLVPGDAQLDWCDNAVMVTHCCVFLG